MRFEDAGIAHVAEKVGSRNLYRAVIAPLVWISDLVAHALQLQDRLLFRFGTHPIKLLNALRHRIFNAPNYVERVRLQFRGEDFPHIRLSQRLSQIIVNVLHTSLPSWLLLLGSPQILAIESEILIDEGLRQVRRAGVCDMEA